MIRKTLVATSEKGIEVTAGGLVLLVCLKLAGPLKPIKIL